MNIIEEKSELTKEEVVELVEKKKEEFKDYIDEDVAATMVAKDLKIKLNEKNPKKSKKKDVVKKEVVQEFGLAVKEDRESLPIVEITRYPSEEEIIFVINRHRFIKEKLLDKNDTMMIQGNEFVKKSGWRKFINAFGISIEILSEKVYKKGDDNIAEYRVKAMAPNGQFVVSEGTKSKSEYWSEKFQNYGSYTLHNLKATARTRAINIAVSDLVGYGAKSVEEFTDSELDGEALPQKDFYNE